AGPGGAPANENLPREPRTTPATSAAASSGTTMNHRAPGFAGADTIGSSAGAAPNRNPASGKSAGPRPGTFPQTAPQGLGVAGGRDVRRQRCPIGVVAQNRGERFGLFLASKRRRASEHLVQHTAEHPDVGASIDSLSARLLGAHVRNGAENRLRPGGADGRR